MSIINPKALQELKNSVEKYKENKPFPYLIIDNFLNINILKGVILDLWTLKLNEASFKFTSKSPYEYNKYTYDQKKLKETNKKYITKVIDTLNCKEFIEILEDLTEIKDIIKNTEGGVKGSGVHRTLKDGYLGIHTDFNTYEDKIHGKMDRRINILIYLNPKWKEEYKGHLKLYEKKTDIEQISDENSNNNKKILPILNRCVIFNTTKDSWHGHDEPLNTPQNVFRNSIANYYYTKSKGENDFEDEKPHSTRWWINNFRDINGK